MTAKRYVAMALLATGLMGCSQSSPSACSRCSAPASQDPPVVVLPQPILQASYPPALLFDRAPSRYSATDFAYRSDWPSTNAYYSPGEAIYYYEHFRDYQGPGWDSWNGTYRRFETRRYGTGYR